MFNILDRLSRMLGTVKSTKIHEKQFAENSISNTFAKVAQFSVSLDSLKPLQ